MEFIQAATFYVLIISEINYVLTSNDGETNTTSELLKHENRTLCTNDKCIMKCCPFGKYIKKKILINNVTKMKEKEIVCDHYNETRDMSHFDRDSDNIFYRKPNLTIFDVKSGIFEVNRTFMTTSRNMAGIPSFNVHLTEHAEMLLEMPNAYDRWIHVPNDMYCLEYQNVRNNLKPGFWVLYKEIPDETIQTGTITAMLISCFFLFVVLVVYMLLPELRNLCGLILMAYVASLLVAFLLLAVMRISQHHEPSLCLGFTLSIYFFFLASFCWMNVMSYDIWWTFRGYAKARTIHRRGKHFKFLMYCLYAWGLPLAMTITLAVLNEIDMSHVPWFVTPKIPTTTCFIKDGEKLLYLNIPMLILILCNWIFFIMTAYNVWRLSRGTAVLDSAEAGGPQAHRSHHRRFLVYIKLSVVMGLNWVLEVVSYKNPESSMWYIADFYNIIIGVSIFLIFVCKRNILKKLTKLFSRCKRSQGKSGQVDSARSTTFSDSTSQETQQVSNNPKGSEYVMKSF